MGLNPVTLARQNAQRRALRPFAHFVSRSGPADVGPVSRHAVAAPPERCTKCGSQEVFGDPAAPSRVACFACGADWYLA